MESTSVLSLHGGLKLLARSFPARKPIKLGGRRKRTIVSMFVEEKVKINETSSSSSSSATAAAAAVVVVQTEKAIWYEDDHFTWGSERLTSTSLAPPPTAEARKAPAHNDNWFDRFAIHYLRKAIEATAGMSSGKEGYDGLVDAAIMISKKFDSTAQQHLVIQSLQKAFPVAIMTVIKILLPQSTFSREYFAAFTTIFFPWLIGPCEVRKSQVNAKVEKNVVYIPKCRFLESTNCVGMCTNLCKIPCQKFIQNSLGMPVYMVPNFEDMSCEMIFGQQPPADDPALKQPCFHKSCIAKQTHAVKCS